MQDSEGWGSANNNDIQRKISVQLKNIIHQSGYIDAFLVNNPGRLGFTWRRRGKNKSRLDRVYIPETRVSELAGPAEHHTHLYYGFHKC